MNPLTLKGDALWQLRWRMEVVVSVVVFFCWIVVTVQTMTQTPIDALVVRLLRINGPR